jgi:hypothetical protein
MERMAAPPRDCPMACDGRLSSTRAASGGAGILPAVVTPSHSPIFGRQWRWWPSAESNRQTTSAATHRNRGREHRGSPARSFVGPFRHTHQLAPVRHASGRESNLIGPVTSGARRSVQTISTRQAKVSGRREASDHCLRAESDARVRADGEIVSQIRTEKSPEAEASLVPSGLKATAWT